MSVREQLGALVGRSWAPAIARISKARHARMFHPEGHTATGRCEPATRDPRFALLARALDGSVLARFSGALWRSEVERFDVLGCALRFRPGAGARFDSTAKPGDTDLLTATIRSPLTMPLSPLFTNAHDFVANRYWAVSPFVHAGVRFELRLSPLGAGEERDHARATRLRRAIAAGAARWLLEARRTLHLHWQPVATIALDALADVDQEALRFDPFRGVLRPVGFVHAIRRAVYAASQAARPDHAIWSPPSTASSAPVM